MFKSKLISAAFFPVVTLMIVFSTPRVTLANQSINLSVNGQEITPDAAPQIINGRVMVPVRWVAEALEAKVHWSEETKTVEIFTGNWLSQLEKALHQAEEEFAMAPDTRGEIKRLWKVRDSYILLEDVWYMDYNYWLCNTQTGQKEWIVPFVENARMEKIEDNEIVFIAKGGADTGDYDFPYILRYNLEKKGLSRTQMYLQRDVIFGTLGSWDLLLEEVYSEGEDIIINFKVAPHQILAGGFKKPLTIVDYQRDFISMRIYGVTPQSHHNQVLEPDHPLIKKVEWRVLSPDEPVKNSALLQIDFPYGAALENVNLSRPSLEVKIYIREAVAYNINSKTEDDRLTYIIKLDPLLTSPENN
ncbi:MAG TPA: copper amine oxidase N-terminal domain-containing protein [Candidatus Atribacteria bacterium]|nr:copper amine oxidase N-terminal domain-containing protein [Candidatus Atribacteria bacterium]